MMQLSAIQFLRSYVGAEDSNFQGCDAVAAGKYRRFGTAQCLSLHCEKLDVQNREDGSSILLLTSVTITN